ncbi:serine/threonine-protein kinase GRIK2 [Cocos nucifera]|uniref:non-specific serine/threonine protein kinase n=1 Tax=Cocos nucifera TaxID=13894 RepID=A0A8K0N1M9_COCNU|nr:serine/threonine-protein kinase GRIK2 [Cocos nucifera]
MSWLFSNSSRGTGCFSCFGFLGKPDKEIDPFLDDRFDQERTLNGDFDGSYGYICEGHRKFDPFLPGKNRVICRESPVKETTHITRGEAACGRKMINEYVRECTIGRGSYGKVVLYRSSIDGKQYAVKAFYKSRLSRVRVTPFETALSDARREVSIMKTLEHPNIINLIEVIDDPDSDQFYIVLEYVEGESICDASGTCGGLGENTSRRYLRDIVSGLMYLHAHGIVHGDIKPENLLRTSSGTVKIGDFSVSHAFEDGNDELWRSPGTPVFTAPECCVGSTYHGKIADIWAVGVTLYCMILGYCPFLGDCLEDTYDKILNSPLYLPGELNPDLKDLLQGLLCKDPKQRMTLDSVAAHRWVVRDCGPIHLTSCRCNLNRFQKESPRGEKTDCT